MATTGITRGEYGNRLSNDERHLLQHIMMWGSAAYPVRKIRSRWIVDTFFNVAIPGVYRTKREATARFEAFINVLVEAAGQEAYEKITAAAA